MKHILIIGGGPAGYPAALKAAALGARVTLVEKQHLGGVCLHAGCIPSKSMLDAAHRFESAFSAATFAGEGAQQAARALFDLRDWGKIQARQQAATRKLTQGISFLLKKANVEVVEGVASFAAEKTVSVQTTAGEQTFTPDGIVVATGSEAFLPPPFDAFKSEIYDNTNFFAMPALPKSLAIIGGGVIGCEMAELMCTLGVEVHVIEMQPRLLPLEDESASRVLLQALTKRGVHFHLGKSATALTKQAADFVLTLQDGSTVTAQKVLVAIGRSVDLTALHAERAGISWTRKGISVNPQTMQVNDAIYAAGDCTGLCQLAHAATYQGEVAAANLCGQPAVYHNERVPRAIYTTPEIASVGFTAQQARANAMDVQTHKSFFLANGRAVAQGQTEGFVELVSRRDTGRLVGGLIVGPQAAELIHSVAVALSAGLSVAQLKEVIFAHPTFSESIGQSIAL